MEAKKKKPRLPSTHEDKRELAVTKARMGSGGGRAAIATSLHYLCCYTEKEVHGAGRSTEDLKREIKIKPNRVNSLFVGKK